MKIKEVTTNKNYEKWIDASKGQGEGKNILLDTEIENPCPDCPYNGEALPEYKICKQCYVDAFGKSPEEISSIEKEKGKIEGEKDLAFLSKEKEKIGEKNNPVEYGSMYGRLPDEITGMGGQMTYESKLHENKFCPSCGGLLGVECFNPSECAEITQNMENNLYNDEQKSLEESQLNEFLGLEKHKEKILSDSQKELQNILKVLYNLDFKKVSKDKETTSVWNNGAYTVIYKPVYTLKSEFKLKWALYVNKNIIENGFGSESFIDAIKKYDGFEKKLSNSLTEADVPSSSGWSGPLTFPQVFLGSKFKTNKEINKEENTTGKMSPLSLLNSPEKDVDDNGKTVPTFNPRGVRSISLPSNMNGIDSINLW